MPRWWTARRFDWLEMMLVCGFAAALAGVASVAFERWRYAGAAEAAVSAAREIAPLRDRFGPGRHSEHQEEWIIRDYFQDRRRGVFVDVGANHYRHYSNTFYLESALEWSGIAIDPQAAFEADYRAHRPRTRFFAFFVSDRSDGTETLYRVEENPLVASAERAFAERAGRDVERPLYEADAVRVPAVRLSDLLDREGIRGFDLLSVDVELAEPKVLAGFDIERFKPSLVCIEAHAQVRQPILDYFAAHGYVVLGRYLRADPRNLYFAPAGSTSPPAPGPRGLTSPAR